MSNEALSWVQVGSSIILACITLWYALTTRGMLKASRDSVDAARQAAEAGLVSARAAERSAKAAEAGLVVTFNHEIRRAYDTSINSVRWFFSLSNTGSRVHLHKIELISVYLVDRPWPEYERMPPLGRHVRLAIPEETVNSPINTGEVFSINLPDALQNNLEDEGVYTANVEVTYSFDGEHAHVRRLSVNRTYNPPMPNYL